MKTKENNCLHRGMKSLGLFALWTLLVRTVDVQAAGETATALGFATFNCLFHQWTGVHMWIYELTDRLGLVPVLVCLGFGFLGFLQLCHRKSLRQVDPDILLLGIYYVAVIFFYLFFEGFPVNYRPILIEGIAEASYPSSTTLLVLSVMPTLVFQADRRLKPEGAKKAVAILTGIFSLAMVIGRLICGVHWLTDILGSVFLSCGLYCLYKSAAEQYPGNRIHRRDPEWNSVKNSSN